MEEEFIVIYRVLLWLVKGDEQIAPMIKERIAKLQKRIKGEENH